MSEFVVAVAVVNSQFVRTLMVQQPTNQQLIASNDWLLGDYCLNKSSKLCAVK